MKKAMKKISEVMKLIFGYGIMICLFAGGLTFFGYMAALIVSSDTAVRICEIINKEIIPIIIQTATFFGDMAALIVGGDTAVRICEIISKEITPIIIQTATFFVIFGLVAMYLGGETALTAQKKQNKLDRKKNKKPDEKEAEA